MKLKVTDQLRRAIKNDPRNCVLFVGAGLSLRNVRTGGRGLPSWSGLMRLMIDDLKNSNTSSTETLKKLEDHFKTGDYLEIAEIYQSETRPDQYSQFLKEYLDPKDLQVSNIHRLILSVGFDAIMTTNFDCIFEYHDNNLLPKVYPYCVDDPPSIAEEKLILKIHGCIKRTNAKDLILTKKSFEKLRKNKRYEFFLTNLFYIKPLLVVGYSLSDPDFIAAITFLAKLFADNNRTIYCLMSDKSEADISLWKVKGVQLIPYSDHAELLPFFAELKEMSEAKLNVPNVPHYTMQDEQNLQERLDALQSLYLNDEIFQGVELADSTYKQYGPHSKVLKHLFRFNIRVKKWRKIREVIGSLENVPLDDSTFFLCKTTLFDCDIREARTVFSLDKEVFQAKVLEAHRHLDEIPPSRLYHEDYYYNESRWYVEIWFAGGGANLISLMTGLYYINKALEKRYTWWFHGFKCIILKLLPAKLDEFKQESDLFFTEMATVLGDTLRPAARSYSITSYLLKEDWEGLQIHLKKLTMPTAPSDFQSTIFFHCDLIFFYDQVKLKKYKDLLENWVINLPQK